MIVIGVDPGSRSPAHVVCDGTQAILCANVPFSGECEAVFIEGQHVRPGIARQSMMTLCYYAGMHAGAYLSSGCDVYELPVDVWRQTVLPRSRALPKDVLHDRLASRTPGPVRSAGPDYVDAYWIAQAGLHFLGNPVHLRQLKKLRWLKC